MYILNCVFFFYWRRVAVAGQGETQLSPLLLAEALSSLCFEICPSAARSTRWGWGKIFALWEMLESFSLQKERGNAFPT